MNLPAGLTTRTLQQALAASAVEQSESQSRVLPFAIEHQRQTAWCWAANAVSISKYFNSKSTFNQCSLVNQQLQQTTCCVDGSAPECNKVWRLDLALAVTGNLSRLTAGRADFDAIRAQVDSQRPVCLYIDLGLGGHFVALYGYAVTANSQALHICVGDPWYGKSLQVYSTFPSNYHGVVDAQWTWTYYTQPNEGSNR